MPDTSPTVRHRRLAAELRRLRERAGLTPAEAAALAGFSRPKLVKIETAKEKPPTLSDVTSILDAYGGGDPLTAALLQLARDIRKRGWWTAYGDVLSESFAELEDAASSVRTWQLEAVPGLLQTPDYTREQLKISNQNEDDVERRVDARRKRQTLLDRKTAPTLDVLLHEVVLRSPVGGPEILRDQLAKLLTATQRPNITVQVMPISVWPRAGFGDGSFTVFGFPEPMDFDVVHLDSVAGDLYIEDVEQVTRCTVMWEHIRSECLPVEETAALISALMEE